MERYIGIVPPIFVEELLTNKKKKGKVFTSASESAFPPPCQRTYMYIQYITEEPRPARLL